MGDLISRDYLLSLANKDGAYGYVSAHEIINAPSVENKGEWIKVQSGDKDFPESIVCSKCGNENSHFDFNEHAEPIGKVFATSKFCPNCGADMRGGVKSFYDRMTEELGENWDMPADMREVSK